MMTGVLLAMPAWAWAALLMAAFVAVSVATMLLTRFAVRSAPPPFGGSADSSAGGGEPANEDARHV
jgi:hypothetical protein